MSEQPVITIVQKKIIKSLLYSHYDIMNIFFARIHTCGKNSEYWLYSGLEGALVYCIDTRVKSCRFLMFDLKSFEIVFDCELYKKFDKAYKKGTERFYYFEVENGFIGLEIPNMSEAEILAASIMSFGDDYIKKKLKEYKPMKENEIKEKAKKMTLLLEKKLNQENAQQKMLRPEIILKNGLLEKYINTVEMSEESGKIIVKGNGYKGVDSELLKLKGLDLDLQTELKVGDTEIFSKYISRNILRSFMKGIIVPKRKINRGEGVVVYKNPKFEEMEEDENKKKNNIRASQRIPEFRPKIEETSKIEESGTKKLPPSVQKRQSAQLPLKFERKVFNKQPSPEKIIEVKEPSPERKIEQQSPERKVEVRQPSPERKIEVVESNRGGIPPPPPPPPPPPKVKTVASSSSSKSSRPIDLAAELEAKKNNLAKVETKDLSLPNIQKKDEESAPQTSNNMMAMIIAQRNQMKKTKTLQVPSQPPPQSSQPPKLQQKPTQVQTQKTYKEKPITSSIKPNENKKVTQNSSINKSIGSNSSASAIKPTAKAGGNSFAAKLSFLQNKMGKPKSDEKEEPKKPIVEIASGNVPRMNLSKLKASLENNMGKSENVSNEPIKVVEGSGAGIPPPPPPPPQPPMK